MPMTIAKGPDDKLLHALAVLDRDWDGVAVAVKEGADLRSIVAESIATMSIFAGREDVAHAMLDHGMPPNVDLVCAAAYAGRTDAMRALTARGCPVDTDRGTTPVEVAARRGQREAIEVALELGAVLDRPGATSNAADAALDGGHSDLATELLDRGCSPWRSTRHPQLDEWMAGITNSGPSDRLSKLVDQALEADLKPCGPDVEPSQHLFVVIDVTLCADEDRASWLTAEPSALRAHAATCDEAVQRLIGERGLDDATLRLLGALSQGQEAVYQRAAALELAASPNRDAIQAAADKTHADLAADLGAVLAREAPAPSRAAIQEQQAATQAPRRDR